MKIGRIEAPNDDYDDRSENHADDCTVVPAIAAVKIPMNTRQPRIRPSGIYTRDSAIPSFNNDEYFFYFFFVISRTAPTMDNNGRFKHYGNI
jgi:hypothetical protein